MADEKHRRFNQDALNDLDRENPPYFKGDRRSPSDVDRILFELELMRNEIASINRAFPNGPEAHRLEHEARLRASQAETEFWQQMKAEAMKKGIAGVIAIGALILSLAVFGLYVKLGIDPTRMMR